MKRPPIVTIMGHVDHGKTTLLDFIRKTKVVEGEHGGITQHIGAYQINEPKMTFIDTPGHAAFSAMRARGGKTADIVVLVIAANDGIKPQTEECFQHIREADVPFIVAINKIDLPEADVDRVKKQLAEAGYLPEDSGGKVVCVPISAQSGAGVSNLLEMISLISEINDSQEQDTDELEAVVIESELDKFKGPMASVIVRNGNLKLGDEIHAETIDGKVKAMFNYLGERVDSAGPSDPVQVLGFNEAPTVGAQVHRGLAHELPTKVSDQPSLGSLPDELRLPVVVKTDVGGVEEAIRASLPEGTLLISADVGEITEADVLLAKTTGAEVVGFNVALPKTVAKLAEIENVKVRTFNIIYELIEYLKDEFQKLIDPLYGLVVKGKAEILAEFKIKKDRIAGSKVLEGELNKDDQIIIVRDDKMVKRVKVKSLRKAQTEVAKVKKGEEFGIVFSPYVDFGVGDTIVGY